ncbi:hypothetical protein [Myroides pelagicus]|uniref:Uncharacterized protein n=1 Tax=Myroides pelagicus TaxID=270914 RepID=A0A7K1GQA5_9FLAO|nr:hypothetical protein [Myroides pelagicus]MTH31095.1 hypothetical protein [Myroides pelagicus]
MDSEVVDWNLNILDSFVGELGDSSIIDSNSFLWRDIDKNKILNFVNSFKLNIDDELGINFKMPLKFVKQYIEDRDTLWDVALYSGEGDEKFFYNKTIKKEKRKLKLKENNHFIFSNRNISSGESEGIVLGGNNNFGSNRRLIRSKMTKPLLMLHIIQPEFLDIKPKDANIEVVAAYGVSFPGDVSSKEEATKVKINSVFIQNLIKQMEEDSKGDD